MSIFVRFALFHAGHPRPAQVKTKKDAIKRLKTALAEELGSRGIEAEIDSERIPATKVHRIWVLSPKFKKMMHTERQDLVWRIADQVLSPAERLSISMIVTLTPEEAGDKKS